jgi:hypothetical protein
MVMVGDGQDKTDQKQGKNHRDQGFILALTTPFSLLLNAMSCKIFLDDIDLIFP